MNFAVNSWKRRLFFGKKKSSLGKLVVRIPPLSWLVTGCFRNRVKAQEMLQLLFGKEQVRLHDYKALLGTCDLERLWAVFGKEFLLANSYRSFLEIRTRDLVVLRFVFRQDKDQSNKWLQSESHTIASSFGSGVCRLNHTLYRFCRN